jgi:DNA replication protein DnaC
MELFSIRIRRTFQLVSTSKNSSCKFIKDKVLVAAMVDRLTHKAYLVNMTGLSYRLKETQKMRQDK